MLARRGFWLFMGIELILIGCLIGSLTATVGDLSTPHGSLEYFINRYQTLIAGTAALGAAGLTTATIWGQIKAAEHHHAEQKFQALGNELDALEGLSDYYNRVGEIAPHVIASARDIDPPPLNLVYRVSMHTSYRISNNFSDLMDRIKQYNASDRMAFKMYGDPLGTSEHTAISTALMGQIAVSNSYVRKRIAAIRAMDPNARSFPSPG